MIIHLETIATSEFCIIHRMIRELKFSFVINNCTHFLSFFSLPRLICVPILNNLFQYEIFKNNFPMTKEFLKVLISWVRKKIIINITLAVWLIAASKWAKLSFFRIEFNKYSIYTNKIRVGTLCTCKPQQVKWFVVYNTEWCKFWMLLSHQNNIYRIIYYFGRNQINFFRRQHFSVKSRQPTNPDQ